jgi:hypothetical protein
LYVARGASGTPPVPEPAAGFMLKTLRLDQDNGDRLYGPPPLSMTAEETATRLLGEALYNAAGGHC